MKRTIKMLMLAALVVPVALVMVACGGNAMADGDYNFDRLVINGVTVQASAFTTTGTAAAFTGVQDARVTAVVNSFSTAQRNAMMDGTVDLLVLSYGFFHAAPAGTAGDEDRAEVIAGWTEMVNAEFAAEVNTEFVRLNALTEQPAAAALRTGMETWFNTARQNTFINEATRSMLVAEAESVRTTVVTIATTDAGVRTVRMGTAASPVQSFTFTDNNFVFPADAHSAFQRFLPTGTGDAVTPAESTLVWANGRIQDRTTVELKEAVTGTNAAPAVTMITEIHYSRA